jgi:hypothetical protein
LFTLGNGSPERESRTMFTVERRTARLVEARVFRLATLADVDEYGQAFTPGMLAGRPTLLADHRPVAIYPQDVAAKMVDLFASLNRRWERAALVVAPTNATLLMQMQRVVRESQNPSRRVFTNAPEACRFLGEILSEAEVTRATQFLDEPVDSARMRVAADSIRRAPEERPASSRRGR